MDDFTGRRWSGVSEPQLVYQNITNSNQRLDFWSVSQRRSSFRPSLLFTDQTNSERKQQNIHMQAEKRSRKSINATSAFTSQLSSLLLVLSLLGSLSLFRHNCFFFLFFFISFLNQVKIFFITHQRAGVSWLHRDGIHTKWGCCGSEWWLKSPGGCF